MSTKKPKSKKSPAESLEVQTPIEAAVITQTPVEPETGKKTAKKASKAKPEPVAAEALEAAAETVETEENPAAKKKKSLKVKVVRDSFSFPEQDYRKISALKKTCLAGGVQVKKSEILRAGLNLLSKLDLAELTQVVEQVEKVKTGRPSAAKN